MDDEIKKAFGVLGVDTHDRVSASDIAEPDGFSKSVISFFGSERSISVVDKLDKAALYGSIGDVVSDFLTEKTGKEIKEKISAAIQYNQKEANDSLSAANAIVAMLTQVPDCTDDISEYELRGTKLRFGVVPKTYSWNKIYEKERMQEGRPSNTAGSSPVEKTAAAAEVTDSAEELMRKHNRCIRNYVGCRVQSLLLETVVSNMDDKKKYKLSVQQASNLGF